MGGGSKGATENGRVPEGSCCAPARCESSSPLGREHAWSCRGPAAGKDVEKQIWIASFVTTEKKGPLPVDLSPRPHAVSGDLTSMLLGALWRLVVPLARPLPFFLGGVRDQQPIFLFSAQPIKYPSPRGSVARTLGSAALMHLSSNRPSCHTLPR